MELCAQCRSRRETPPSGEHGAVQVAEVNGMGQIAVAIEPRQRRWQPVTAAADAPAQRKMRAGRAVVSTAALVFGGMFGAGRLLSACPVPSTQRTEGSPPVETVSVSTPRGNHAVLHVREGTSDLSVAGSTFAGVTGAGLVDEYRLADTYIAHRFVDVGAHIGTVTVAVLLDNPTATAICVEPIPENVAMIRANLEANGLTARATVLIGAAGTNAISYGFSGSEVAKTNRYIANLARSLNARNESIGSANDEDIPNLPRGLNAINRNIRGGSDRNVANLTTSRNACNYNNCRRSNTYRADFSSRGNIRMPYAPTLFAPAYARPCIRTRANINAVADAEMTTTVIHVQFNAAMRIHRPQPLMATIEGQA